MESSVRDPSDSTVTVIFTHSSLLLFDQSCLTCKIPILSHIAIVKIVIVHFGSFCENTSEIFNNFQFKNQYFPLSPISIQIFSSGKQVAVIFLERCSEEMLIFNDAFLWLRWVSSLNDAVWTTHTSVLSPNQSTQPIAGTGHLQTWMKSAGLLELLSEHFREIPVASLHDYHPGNSWRMSDFGAGGYLSHPFILWRLN